MFVIHYCPCHLEYMSVFSFGYSVLLRCVLASKFPHASFLSKVYCEGIGEVLLAAVRSKAPYMLTCCLFDFVFEFLEVWEHFTLLPHMKDLGVPREVVNEHHIVSATTECCRLGWAPCIWMYYIQDSFAYVPLFRERLSMLLLKLTSFAHSNKVGSPITTPFSYIPLSFWRLMWSILLCHNSMSTSVLWPVAIIVDFISWESRMDILPSLDARRSWCRSGFPLRQMGHCRHVEWGELCRPRFLYSRVIRAFVALGTNIHDTSCDWMHMSRQSIHFQS